MISRHHLKGTKTIQTRIPQIKVRPRTFQRAMARTSLHIYWDLGYKGVNDPYLCLEDQLEVIDEIKDRSRAFNCIFSDELLILLHEKRVDRITSA